MDIRSAAALGLATGVLITHTAFAQAIDLTGPGAARANWSASYPAAPNAGDTASVFVQNNGTALQYTGVLLNVDPAVGADNVFIKVQNQDGDDQFEFAGCYIGNNINGFGLGFFELSEPFNSAQLTASRSGSTVTVSLTNVDGGAKADQTYTCEGAPPPEGDRIGVNAFAGLATLDNFGDGNTVLDMFSFTGPLPNSGDWTDIEPGMQADGSVAFGGPLARSVYTGGGMGGGIEFCVDFTNFADGITVRPQDTFQGPLTAVWENWDGAGSDAPMAGITTGGRSTIVCTDASCPNGEDWAFVVAYPIGGFWLVNLTSGTVFQENSPFTLAEGVCPFGPEPGPVAADTP